MENALNADEYATFEQIVSMGFDRNVAIEAAYRSQGDIQCALDLIDAGLSGQIDLDETDEEEGEAASKPLGLLYIGMSCVKIMTSAQSIPYLQSGRGDSDKTTYKLTSAISKGNELLLEYVQQRDNKNENAKNARLNRINELKHRMIEVKEMDSQFLKMSDRLKHEDLMEVSLSLSLSLYIYIYIYISHSLSVSLLCICLLIVLLFF